jgi:hypothetical protein
MRILMTTVAGLSLATLTVPVQAQPRDWARAHRIIRQAQEDLHRVQRHEAWKEGDRGHYAAAERNLADVSRDLDQNRLDRRRLDATIEEMEYITHVDALGPREREALNNDARELHRLRDDWHWE